MHRFWYVADSSQDGWEVKLPTTTAQIIVNLDADTLTTQRPGQSEDRVLTAGPVGISPIASTPVLLDRREQRQTAGIVLRPEAVGAVAGIPARELGLLVGLDELWGPATERIAEAAVCASSGNEALDRIEAELLAAFSGRIRADGMSRVAIERLRRGMPVARVADAIGLSHSALTRRFRAAVGMTPKQYQRLLRFEHAIGLATGDDGDWASISVRSGYHDQAHFTHDFHELTGLTPTQWRRKSRSNPFHLG